MALTRKVLHPSTLRDIFILHKIVQIVKEYMILLLIYYKFNAK